MIKAIKSTLLGLLFLVVTILLGSLFLVIINEPEKTRSFVIDGTGFLFPGNFKVGKFLGDDIRFYIDGETLQQKTNPSFKNGDIEVRLFSQTKQAGAWFVHEKSIDYSKCSYEQLKHYKICTYTVVEHESSRKINIVLNQNKTIRIASICHIAPVQPEGLTTVCTSWAPFMDKFKIAYSYQHKFQDKIIEIDAHAKSIFEKAERNYVTHEKNTETKKSAEGS